MSKVEPLIHVKTLTYLLLFTKIAHHALLQVIFFLDHLAFVKS